MHKIAFKVYYSYYMCVCELVFVYIRIRARMCVYVCDRKIRVFMKIMLLVRIYLLQLFSVNFNWRVLLELLWHEEFSWLQIRICQILLSKEIFRDSMLIGIYYRDGWKSKLTLAWDEFRILRVPFALLLSHTLSIW